MSTTVKKIAPVQQKIKASRFRITLCSTNVKDLERVVKDLLRQAKTNKVKVAGPTRMPIKNLTVSTRRAPSGQGTATFETYTMRIYKRVIDVNASPEMLKTITSISMAPTVDVVFTIQ
jgi:small subunit ribosomal protein S20e